MTEERKKILAAVTERAENFVKGFDPEFAAGYMKKREEAEAEELLIRAGELMDQTFVFADKWDMEPCREPYTLTEMKWQRTPNGDPEWIFMLNRHDYLHKLMMAYYLTGNEAYTDKLKWYLFHWMCHNPILPEGSDSTRTIDTGIRCMNWEDLILHLAGNGMLTQEELDELLLKLDEQFENLRQRYIGKYTLSNWGLLQTTAICEGYLLFGDSLCHPDTGKWAWQELKRQLDLQVMDDGSHWEQSVMYHMEVLLASMRLMKWKELEENNLCPERYRSDFPEEWDWLKALIEKMSLYVLYCAGPDHRQPAQCDSDRTDVRDIMVKASVLTGNSVFRFGGYEALDLESLWLFGRKGAERYEAAVSREPERLDYHAQDTGNIYIRSSWKEDANYTYLSCGPQGSGHGHGDLTHISLYYQGKPFLIDSGRYSYREDEPLRMEFKMLQAHNVCVIDDGSLIRPDGSWSFHSYGDCFKTYYREKEGISYCEMAYRGRLANGEGCLVTRKVMTAREGLWLIVNDIWCEGKHTVREYYHLDPDAEARAAEDEILLTNGSVQLKALGEQQEHGPWTQPVPIPFQLESCKVSLEYNRLSDSMCLVKEGSFSDSFVSSSAFCGAGVQVSAPEVYQFGAGEPVSDGRVTAKTFHLSEEEYWTFLVWNRETFRGGKMYECSGVPVYGKAGAIHRLGGEQTWIRLRN